MVSPPGAPLPRAASCIRATPSAPANCQAISSQGVARRGVPSSPPRGSKRMPTKTAILACGTLDSPARCKICGTPNQPLLAGPLRARW